VSTGRGSDEGWAGFFDVAPPADGETLVDAGRALVADKLTVGAEDDDSAALA
jgi:hypothetical protein